MEINRLSKDELAYELKVRGVTDITTVSEMRSTLRHLRRLERTLDYVPPSYPFTFAEDKAAIESNIDEITQLITDFSNTMTSPEFKKIATKIAHSISRTNRSQPNASLASEKSQLLVQTKVKQFHKNAKSVKSDVDYLTASDQDSGDCSTNSDPPTRTGLSTHMLQQTIPVSPTLVKPVAVAKWNLHYNGDNRNMSVNAFIERVEEMRVARGISKENLFQSALDLFREKALIWYRANRTSYRDWDELVVGLREEFQPPDYDEKLLDEVKRRTQGSNESIGIYLSVMATLFSRFTHKISQAKQLKIIMRNLLPFYQTQLALVDITSTTQLLKLGRQLEARRTSVELYAPPPTRNRTLEPDLAYIQTQLASTSVDSRPPKSSGRTPANKTCWNCNRSGHFSKDCTQPKKKHCYKCGEPDVTVATCRRCTGNFRRTH
ncbi:Zinc knuckle [Popillia japonica]|uniref:Zinc knuckle n=1 Tax=Popillia japonica TaxID=7064 RepID=A0AAW1JIL7_POPJA